MAKFEDKYDQLKIERLKETLQKQAEAGRAPYFEIYVDGLKAVPKTNDLSQFDHHENFIMEDSEKIRILVYTSNPASPRNDQFTYLFKKSETSQVVPVLNGIDIEKTIDEKLKQQREKWESDQLKAELEKTKKQLKESEDYADKLEAELSALREKKSHVGNVNLGELASVALEGFVRRNTDLIAKIPGAESLAGIIEADTKQKFSLPQKTENAQPETEITFTKKTNAVTANETEDKGLVRLTEEEKNYIAFMRSVAECFDEQEIILLTQIIQKMEEDPARLTTVAELLDISLTKNQSAEQVNEVKKEETN